VVEKVLGLTTLVGKKYIGWNPELLWIRAAEAESNQVNNV